MTDQSKAKFPTAFVFIRRRMRRERINQSCYTPSDVRISSEDAPETRRIGDFAKIWRLEVHYSALIAGICIPYKRLPAGVVETGGRLIRNALVYLEFGRLTINDLYLISDND
jgi:hypothetical protein